MTSVNMQNMQKWFICILLFPDNQLLLQFTRWSRQEWQLSFSLHIQHLLLPKADEFRTSGAEEVDEKSRHIFQRFHRHSNPSWNALVPCSEFSFQCLRKNLFSLSLVSFHDLSKRFGWKKNVFLRLVISRLLILSRSKFVITIPWETTTTTAWRHWSESRSLYRFFIRIPTTVAFTFVPLLGIYWLTFYLTFWQAIPSWWKRRQEEKVFRHYGLDDDYSEGM